MGEKKSKALALELMDDLLKEDGDAIEIEGVTAATEPESTSVETDVTAQDSTHGGATAKVHEFTRSKTHPLADTAEVRSPKRAGAKHSAPPAADKNFDKTEISDPDMTHHHDAHTAPRAANDSDATERIRPSQLPGTGGGSAEDRVRASVGRYAPLRSGGPATATEAALAQSESLRIAQSRLLEFEQEIERLRLQNEELAAAGETLRRRTDELAAANQKRESDYQNLVNTFEKEKEILVNSKEAVQRELVSHRQKNEELELRISTNIQKIRVRERELENRLELVKMESAALIRSKDEMILELKRNIDQLNLELNNYRTKNQELNRLTTDKQEQLRRTVKALRLALSMLEGEEEAPRTAAAPAAPVKKAK